MYQRIKKDGTVIYPYNPNELRRDYSNVSFPKVMPDELLAEYNVFPVKQSERPSDEADKQIIEDTPTLVNGEWVQRFRVEGKSSEVIESEYQHQADSARSQRNQLLAETDWTQLNDTPVDGSVWMTYRQQLRDITLQDGFPFNIQWPSLPQ